MQDFKKHIALILLICFSFPQLATSMHYVLNEHQSIGETLQYLPATKEIGHNCTYHLSSVFYRITNFNYPLQDSLPNNFVKQNCCSLENYVFELAFNYRLRGPPVFTFTQQNQKRQHTI